MSLFELDRSQPHRPMRTSPAAIALQAVGITAAFAAYLVVRSLANGSETAAHRHAARVLEVEATLGIDVEQRLQAAALDLPGVIDVFNFVYAWTYWPFIIGAFVVTWFWTKASFSLYRNAMLISGAIGLAVFTVLPVAPPRFLDGFVDTVDQSARSNFIGHPEGFINEFAALPSFHVGWVALASAVLFIAAERRWVRALLVLPTILMAVAVVLTANHYVIDIVAGVGLSMVSLLLASTLARRSSAPLEEVPRKL
ncbi:MAG: phosphatase PAP2 family protein [Ilumatobacter sp.]|uniref:phosphatase PAP2 family protein n=1 Tax=Ilumatobacter sp. TaxID=1967498 RepID=UPI003C745425